MVLVGFLFFVFYLSLLLWSSVDEVSEVCACTCIPKSFCQ